MRLWRLHRCKKKGTRIGLFRDEHGFTTTSMALALLLSLSLVFSSAQVYRVNALSAKVQDVADAAALAAQNQVADYVLSARVCDAIVLSLSLTSLASYGLGVVACCIPPAQPTGERLIGFGDTVSEARDSFAQQATEALDAFQRALPFLAAVRASSVVAANGSQDSSYVGFALLVPTEGKEVSGYSGTDVTDAGNQISSESSELKEQANKAEEASKAMDDAKLRAFMRDCGDDPSYCLYERASKLAGLSEGDNPFYSSVDAWSFQVPLERAQKYYRARIALEAPADSTIAEQARSALRKRFYEFASEKLQEGFVRQTEDSFEAYFPSLPKNTDEMRETSLYDEVAYPITAKSDKRCMHAWAGCPNAQGAIGLGSLRQLDQGESDFVLCGACEFSAASLGSVAAASTSIDNGFEYHYAAIAQAAKDYQEAYEKFSPLAKQAKSTASRLFELVKEQLGKAAACRISVEPPGRFGAIALAARTGGSDADLGIGGSLVSTRAALGPSVAVSAATLLEEESDEGRNAINSLLDAFKDQGVGVGAASIVLDVWAGLLDAYSDGQNALLETVEGALDRIPLASSSGLGSWAAGKLKDAVEAAGLAPAKVASLKPVLVNSGNVASHSDSQALDSFLQVKKAIVQNPLQSTNVLSSLAGNLGSSLKDKIEGMQSIEVAKIDLFGTGKEVSIEIPLPESLRSQATTAVEGALAWLKGLAAQISGGALWE